jgi:hypothetical protein
VSNNPYQAPTVDEIKPTAFDFGSAPMARRGLVGHVRVISILMIAQGVLEALMGVFLIGMGVFMAVVIGEGITEEEAMPPAQAQATVVMMLVMYVGMGLVNAVAAGLHIFAAIQNYKFKSRTLGIVALSVGCATLLTCYCGPTSIALAVYGLIVFLNAEVGYAFKMAESGYTGDQILASFGEGHYPPK